MVRANGVEMPDPGKAVDLAEFIGLLGELRTWAGQPSYRSLAKRVGPLMRPAQTVSPFTVVDVFKVDRRRLDIDLVTAIVRALGLDEPTVAMWRVACVRVHTNGKTGGPVGVFRQLPTDLATFTGRQEQLRHLLDAASAGPSASTAVVVSAIEGMGGVGKTQLAIHAAHQLVQAGRFADAQLYVNLRGFDPERAPAHPADVLDGFLRALGVPGQHIPAGLDERAAMFRDRMHDKDALILLDNAASEDQIRDLIPATPSCLVVITSRRSLAGLDGASFHLLDTFNTTDSLELMGRIAGPGRIGAEPEAAARIAASCGHLPLAIALAASRLRTRPAWTLTEFANRLDAMGLDALNAGGRALRPVFDLSSQGLPGPARRLFSILGLHPGDDFTTPAAAAAGDLDCTEAQAILEQLQDEHLLQCTTNGRYRFHDLIRSYAADLATALLTPDQRRDMSHRIINWYLEGADDARRLLDPGREHPLLDGPARRSGPGWLTDADDALRWCDAEAGNLRACANLAASSGHPDAAWRLPVVLLGYYQLRGRWDEVERTHQAALDHLQATGGNPAAEALVLRGAGAASARRHEYDWAAQRFGQILDLDQRKVWPVDRAYAFHNLSILAHDQQRYADSMRNSEQALTIFENVADSYGQALSRSALAVAANALGDFPLALVHGEAAFDLAQALGSIHQQARAALALGETHYLVHDYHRALARHEQALELNRRAGYLVGQAEAHYELGLTNRALQRHNTARDHLEQALTILRQLDAPEAATVEAYLASIKTST